MREAISVLLMALPVIGLYLVIRNGVRSFRQPKRIVSDAQGKKKISTNPWFFLIVFPARFIFMMTAIFMKFRRIEPLRLN